jgi:transcriptional regulator with XRE-family HTH domain
MSANSYGADLRFRAAFARKRSGLSQTRLAQMMSEHLGRPFDRAQLAKSEIGARTFKPDEIATLALILNVTADALLGLTELVIPAANYEAPN